MNEAEAYTAKEHAKDRLATALREYIEAATAADMDDHQQTSDLEDIIRESGKQWDVLPQ